MLQTLFHVPVWIFSSPWIWVWAGILLVVGIYQSRKSNLGDALFTWGMPLGFLIVFSKFVIPEITDWGLDPQNPAQAINMGLPVRGYGMMMLLGILGGIGTAVARGKREGFGLDHIISLAITLAIFGILGARLFYVIQYWDRYSDLSGTDLIVSVLNMTQGGLVVFGSFFGATIAMIIWCRLKHFHFGKVADIVGPGFLVGLAFGRIGCLLNGCCFGGACEIPNLGMEFPAGSPPYQRQLEDGTVFGLKTTLVDDETKKKLDLKRFGRSTNQTWRKVLSVEDRSTGELLGLKPGNHYVLHTSGHPEESKVGFDKVLRFAVKNSEKMAPKKETPLNEIPSQLFLSTDEKSTSVLVPWNLVPQNSKPIHPTQLYSSLSAACLAIAVWFFYRFRKFDGQAFAFLVAGYSVARFILEWIRQDEGGQLGTDITISQWVSLVLGPVAIASILFGLITGWKKLPEGTVRVDGLKDDQELNSSKTATTSK